MKLINILIFIPKSLVFVRILAFNQVSKVKNLIIGCKHVKMDHENARVNVNLEVS